MTLQEAQVGVEYVVQAIQTDDDELNGFLFTLGCYLEQPITLISKSSGGYLIAVKDGRYVIDKELAQTIII